MGAEEGSKAQWTKAGGLLGCGREYKPKERKKWMRTGMVGAGGGGQGVAGEAEGWAGVRAGTEWVKGGHQ